MGGIVDKKHSLYRKAEGVNYVDTLLGRYIDKTQIGTFKNLSATSPLWYGVEPVSYTHLTLPTIYSV